MRNATTWTLLVILALVLAACSNQGALDELDAQARKGAAADYIISSIRALSADLPAVAARNGDSVKHFNSEAGFAVVTTSNPSAYNRFADVVVRNVTMQWIAPGEQLALADVGDPPFSGSADILFDLQWGHTAVRAPAAWNAGVRGEGVRVAVLDTGFDLTHPDLIPNIDVAASADMTGEGLQYTLNDPFSHGTHVAGTIAAAQNDFGVIGVAPDATLILVKVLGDEGSGSWADIMAGIMHATDAEADIINMSLGAACGRRGYCLDAEGNRVPIPANELASLITAMNRVLSYAHRQGVTIISSAGNRGLNSNETADLMSIPSDNPHVISISATAPIGWATDPLNTNLDNLASYSNYGLSSIDFAAPGGDYVYPGNEVCTIGPITQFCWVLDFVFSTGSRTFEDTTGDGVPDTYFANWYWSVGTSMASPHAAGVAALIISEHGGSMRPAQVRAEMARRAEDLGKPGRDEVYGHGRVSSGY